MVFDHHGLGIAVMHDNNGKIVVGNDTKIEVIVVSPTTWEAHHSPRAVVSFPGRWWQETHQPLGTEVPDSEALWPQLWFESHQASQRSQECWVHYQLRSSEQQTAGFQLWCVCGPNCMWTKGWPTCIALPGPSGLANQARSSVLCETGFSAA